ncbi:hypothetical protein PISMIDRAFT_675365 [Pisolithus microcarpus 441]|uniref:Uncharacterized protein n=1 Tax=Pisolithus microcarpus 441 TaxID=765257 RepID=A0A0C9YPU1_9AGAM|nr:hypothetical protein PISMIDRAFT_675365 [Pisolithus microcarpus 441]
MADNRCTMLKLRRMRQLRSDGGQIVSLCASKTRTRDSSSTAKLALKFELSQPL